MTILRVMLLYLTGITEGIMGSIRSSNVKRIAERLVEENRDLFTKDFRKNREVLIRVLSGASKKLLNAIAGYVTRYVIKKETREKREAEELGFP